MNPRLQQIMRDIERKKPKPKPAEKAQPAGDLADAISTLIAEQVEARVSEALAQQRDRLQPTGPRLRQMLNAPPAHTDFSQAPEPPKTPKPMDMTALIHRDETGRAKWLEIGTARFDLQRDGQGRITRMVQRTEK